MGHIILSRPTMAKQTKNRLAFSGGQWITIEQKRDQKSGRREALLIHCFRRLVTNRVPTVGTESIVFVSARSRSDHVSQIRTCGHAHQSVCNSCHPLCRRNEQREPTFVSTNAVAHYLQVSVSQACRTTSATAWRHRERPFDPKIRARLGL
jgi:hypothetical protein